MVFRPEKREHCKETCFRTDTQSLDVNIYFSLVWNKLPTRYNSNGFQSSKHTECSKGTQITQINKHCHVAVKYKRTLL